MILQYVSALWAAVAPALADHLWQSTLFALVAGVLTLALRKNSAHLRYSLWLAASLKFLVPFSLLVAIGGHLSWRHSSAASAGGLYVVEEVGRPFTSALPLAHPPVRALAATGTALPWLPILFGVWLCGFLIVLFIWIARWSRISATIRSAAVLKEGREVSTLRRLERLAEMPMPMNILLSRGPLELGVFGILRPVLLWPHSISEHLDDAHLEAVLAHELHHVRRRDNLAAGIHLVVEAIFWFHPLVWWLGSRLIDERERAFGLLNATPSHAEDQLGGAPKFASVSIKPHATDDHSGMTRTMLKLNDGSFSATNVSPHSLLQIAYHVQDTQLVGQPDWFNSAKYDVEAKVDASTADELKKLPEDQRGLIGQRMIQQLLADYFKVTLHQASLDLPVYELVIAESGSKLQKAGEHGFMHMDLGELSSKGTPLELLTAQLSQRLGRTVVDKTGLQGDYAYTLRWTPDADEVSRIRAAGGPPELAKVEATTPTADAPPLMTALEEQLGLKLQSETTRVPVLVIDHAEQPAAN
jgi:uncharacterized protein (TIGR03435 family)